MVNNIRSLLHRNKRFDRNINLYLLTSLMINTGFGMIEADFNLYILSMGIPPEFLGIILSLTPFAQAFAAIPLGYLAEKIGNKRALILVNLVVGSSYLIRSISSNEALIMLGSFLVGTVQAGYFIIQMPFISNYAGKRRDKEYAFASIAHYTARAIGNLIGGFLPVAMGLIFIVETEAFRSILILASFLILFGTIPLLLLNKDKPTDTSKISLSPYLNGIDKNTVRFATVEFFLGTGFGFLMFFMNVIFVYYYNSNLQSYGTMSAILIIPTVIFLFVGPALAKRFGGLRVILISRIFTGIFAFLVIMTKDPLFGASAYVLFRSFLGLGTSLWLSFASSVATRRSRAATSTWLEITFQIGFAAAAFGGGLLIARDAYPVLGTISGISMFMVFILTGLFFGKKYLSMDPVQE